MTEMLIKDIVISVAFCFGATAFGFFMEIGRQIAGGKR